jgi:hypothetical protein
MFLMIIQFRIHMQLHLSTYRKIIYQFCFMEEITENNNCTQQSGSNINMPSFMARTLRLISLG